MAGAVIRDPLLPIRANEAEARPGDKTSPAKLAWCSTGCGQSRCAFDEHLFAGDLIQAYEARIAALERLVGRQALELEFPKGAVRSGVPPGSAPMFVISGPLASRLRADAV